MWCVRTRSLRPCTCSFQVWAVGRPDILPFVVSCEWPNIRSRQEDRFDRERERERECNACSFGIRHEQFYRCTSAMFWGEGTEGMFWDLKLECWERKWWGENHKLVMGKPAWQTSPTPSSSLQFFLFHYITFTYITVFVSIYCNSFFFGRVWFMPRTSFSALGSSFLPLGLQLPAVEYSPDSRLPFIGSKMDSDWNENTSFHPLFFGSHKGFFFSSSSWDL